MSRCPRRNPTPAFKAKVALAAVKGEKTLAKLGLSRSSVYYQPTPASEADLALMRRMGLAALYRKPDTSRRAAGQQVYPYLLRGVAVDRPHQGCAMDITYIPMAPGGHFHIGVNN